MVILYSDVRLLPNKAIADRPDGYLTPSRVARQMIYQIAQ